MPKSAPGPCAEVFYGRGVEQDVVQGCALLWESHELALAPRHDQAGIDIAKGLIDEHCKSLSADQLAEVVTVSSCAFIGLQRQVLPLQPGSWIEFSRRGYALERPSGGLKTGSLATRPAHDR